MTPRALRCSALLGLIVLAGIVRAEPACSSSCNPLCGAFYLPTLHTDQLTVSDPTLGLLGSTVWNQCNIATCCSTTTCSLSISSHTVTAGIWSQTSNGLSLTAELPPGVVLASGGLVTINGSSTVTIPAQFVASCALGRCQSSNYKVGPGYTSMTKTQEVQKMCMKNVGSGCALANMQLCDVYVYQASITARYLSVEVLLTGVCGLASSSCTQCANPAQPACS